MAKRSRKNITETIAQQTASIPEVVGIPETEFKSAFEGEKIEEKPAEEPKPLQEKPKPKKKVKVSKPALNPVSPHHKDSMTSGINFSLGSIL